MSETQKTRSWSYLGAIPAAIAGLLGTILVIGETLEKLVGGPALSYLFILADMLRWEIVAFLVLFFLRKPLLSGFAMCLRSLVYFLRRARREPAYWWRAAAAASVVIALIAVSGHQLSRYAIGKALFVKHSASTLANRAHHAYEEGSGERAALYLRAGAQVFKHDDFASVLEWLEGHLTRAARLRDILTLLPPTSPHRRELIHAIAAEDRKSAIATKLIEDNVQRLRSLKTIYVQGVEALRKGQLDLARARFDEVHKVAPAFGDVHMIRRELSASRLTRNAIDSDAHPYLRALRRGGPEIVETLTRPAFAMAEEPEEETGDGSGEPEV